ncbi:MAG: hypothetical protein HY512_03545 [Candidatus Aenigmarchaeota archaeon]|nr:hypothetical protein [Candidatus Aenigmarchaeota archaeon]
MGEIYLGLSKEVHASRPIKDGKRAWEVTYTLPEKPEVLNYDLRQSPRYWFQTAERLMKQGVSRIASEENPLVTPSAGAVSVFVDEQGNPQYISFVQKDAKAPRDPGFRVPRNGFPRSEEDWHTNAHLYREAFEEGVFVTRGGELLVPADGQHKEIIYGVADMLAARTLLKIKGEKAVPITFAKGADRLKVFREPDKRAKLDDYGVISWTPETGFNFIKIMNVQYPVEDLWIVDGEQLPDGTTIQRDVCVIDLKHLAGKVFGNPIHETVHRRNRYTGEVEVFERNDRFLCDKVPRSVLNQVLVDGKPVYPIDWFDESYIFLFHPEILADMNKAGNAWSALEKNMFVDEK